MSASRNHIGVAGRLGPLPVRGVELRYREVHGYRRAFRVAGAGPPVVLLHGIGDSSATWESVIPALARDHLVIAPDLLGHGHSDKPRADYSVAGFANGVRDLLGVLGINRASLVGHSLGGGVAARRGGVDLRALGTALGQDAPDLLRAMDALPDSRSRTAFIRSLYAVVDWRGQVVTMLDRCYLAAGMPTMLVWGSRDAVIPVSHGYRAHAAMPGSRLEIFDGAGHFPFHTDPQRFVELLRDFLTGTRPATWSVEQWRQLLRAGRPRDTIEHELTENPVVERNAT